MSTPAHRRPKGGRHAVHRVEWPDRGRHGQDHHGRRHQCALSRCGRGRAGAVPALLRSRHHRVDHVSQGGRRAVNAVPLHPDGPAELFEDRPDRLSRGGARAPGADRGRPPRRPRHCAGILGRQFAGRAVGDGGGHRLPRAGPEVRDGRLAYRHRRRPLPVGQSPLGGQPGHSPSPRRPEPRQYPALPLGAHRRREPGDRRARQTTSTGRTIGRPSLSRRAANRSACRTTTPPTSPASRHPSS